MDINQLKQEARELERQSRYREALAMYRHALTSLEGSPQLLRELPLYVKAGDLYLKLDKVKAGVSLYEQVGKIYAAHGSAKSVGAVCIKVVRAMPERAHVYPRMVRIMLERGHVGPARAVLELWAEHARLRTTHELLNTLDEVSDDDMRAVLESIVEMAERLEASPETSSAAVAAAIPAESEPATAEAEAPTPAPPTPEVPVTSAVEEPSAPDEASEAPTTPEPEAEPAVAEEEPAPAAPEDDQPASHEPLDEDRAAPEPPAVMPEEEPEAEAPAAEPETEEEPTAEAEEEPVWLEPTPAAEEPESGEEQPAEEVVPRRSTRRPSFGSVLIHEPKKRAGPSGRAILIGVAAVVIVVALIAIPIVWLGLSPFGGTESGGATLTDTAGQETPSLAVPMDPSADSGIDSTLPMTLDPNPAFAAEPIAEDSAVVIDSAPVDSAALPPPDTNPAAPVVEELESPPAMAPAVIPPVTTADATAGVVVAIEGLGIESVRAVTRVGEAGQEVTQILESGEEVTVFSYRTTGGPDASEVGMEGDLRVGRARVGGFMAEIRGPGGIEATVMWQLIDRLAVRNAPSN